MAPCCFTDTHLQITQNVAEVAGDKISAEEQFVGLCGVFACFGIVLVTNLLTHHKTRGETKKK